jgi:hypothetical protein
MTSFNDAFRDDIDPETGGWKDSLTTVKKKISKMTSESDGMWIGIASNGVDGARARWNAKYKGLGMRYMAIAYETSSDHFRKEMERDLCEFYGDYVDNEKGGGGGGHGSAPYVVYVAWN